MFDAERGILQSLSFSISCFNHLSMEKRILRTIVNDEASYICCSSPFNNEGMSVTHRMPVEDSVRHSTEPTEICLVSAANASQKVKDQLDNRRL